MNIARLIVWIVVTAAMVGFMVMNWGDSHPVRIWPGSEADYLFEWPIGFVALVFFLIGFLPMWLLNKGVSWRLRRRIESLERAARTSSSMPATPPPTPAPTPRAPEPAADKRLTPDPDSTGA